jgi:hypothetical protein
MLFNQLIDMPHLSGGWIILKNDKMLTNRDVNRFVHKIGEKYTFCVSGKLLGSFISAHCSTMQQYSLGTLALSPVEYPLIQSNP